MLKKFLCALLLLLFAVTCAGAHPGKLDEYGGHYDKKTGKYHYHKKTPDAGCANLPFSLTLSPTLSIRQELSALSTATQP